jgi:hypothetical protein
MLIGSGVAGGRTIGGHDETFRGSLVDPVSGEVTSSGEDLTAEMLGATLLALADIDPGESFPGVPVLESLIEG